MPAATPDKIVVALILYECLSMLIIYFKVAPSAARTAVGIFRFSLHANLEYRQTGRRTRNYAHLRIFFDITEQTFEYVSMFLIINTIN